MAGVVERASGELQRGRPLKVLLTSVGSRGDVQPMLVLGAELARRGHDVCLAAPPNFRALAAPQRIDYLPLGVDTAQIIQENKQLAERNPLLSLPAQLALFRHETARQLQDILRFSGTADVVVGAGLSFGGRLLADKLGAAYVNVAYSLAGLRSAAYPPAAIPVYGLPRWGNRTLWTLLVALFDGVLGPVIARERKAQGLSRAPAWRSIFGSSNLLAQDELLGEVPPDAVGYTERVPALVPEAAPEPLPRAVEEFIAGGVPESVRSPTVYVGFGSMPTVDRERVLRILREVQRTTRARILLFSAYGEDDASELPPGIFALPEVNHAALFPRMDLLVHHGGAGTTATALRAGVPQLIVPHVHDQFFHGRRIHELGLGNRPRSKAKLDAKTLLDAIESSRHQRERARAVSEALAHGSGARQAAEFLERLAGR